MFDIYDETNKSDIQMCTLLVERVNAWGAKMEDIFLGVI